MHVPEHFRQDDPETLARHIRERGVGLLIVADGDGIEANHVPFLLEEEEDGAPGVLHCHLARANPVWLRLRQGPRVLAVFQGPDAYISPGWYPTKAETGRVVPTWNYLAVHVEGPARVIEDPAWLQRHVRRLTDRHEAGREAPWAVDDAPADFTDRLIGAIVGVEIRIETLTGKLKASQNQPARNRAGVRAGLEQAGDTNASAMSRLIR